MSINCIKEAITTHHSYDKADLVTYLLTMGAITTSEHLVAAIRHGDIGDPLSPVLTDCVVSRLLEANAPVSQECLDACVVYFFNHPLFYVLLQYGLRPQVSTFYSVINNGNPYDLMPETMAVKVIQNKELWIEKIHSIASPNVKLPSDIIQAVFRIRLEYQSKYNFTHKSLQRADKAWTNIIRMLSERVVN